MSGMLMAGFWPTAITDAHSLIASQTVGAGGVASVTFSSIPQTFKHLQIRMVSRSSLGALDSNVILQCNGDIGANYAFHKVVGVGASASSAAVASTSSIQTADIPGDNAPAGVFGVGVVDILDYANTTKNKTVRTLSGQDQNGHGYASLKSGLRMSTAAISSITLATQDGSSFHLMQYSTFALYGWN